MSDTTKPHRVISVTVNEWEIDNLRDRNLLLAKKFIAAGVPIDLKAERWLEQASSMDTMAVRALWRQTFEDAGVFKWSLTRPVDDVQDTAIYRFELASI